MPLYLNERISALPGLAIHLRWVCRRPLEQECPILGMTLAAANPAMSRLRCRNVVWVSAGATGRCTDRDVRLGRGRGGTAAGD